MLAIPRLLEELVAAGRWPRDSKAATVQNLRPLALPERVQALAPEEHLLYLLPPPFYTVRQQSTDNPFWSSDVAAPHGIDFDLTIAIGDFGLGSDAPVLLDYRDDPTNPRVIRLRYPSVGANDTQWVLMAADFAAFVETLGL